MTDGKGKPPNGSPRRVGRPRQLTTSEVVDEAIQLCDENGLEALSMPRLARRLGVGTMTLYGYVANKSELLDKIASEMFRDLTVSDHTDWHEALISFCAELRRAALAHATLVRLLATGRVTIPAVFDVLQALFEKATDQGIAIDDAARTFYAALSYTIGFMIWEAPRTGLQADGQYASQWIELASGLDPTRYALVGEARETLSTVASIEQFHWGLNRLVSGPAG
jgi:TetR/AcrR family transcriptional regulator, tetracycline repressor protein